MAVSPGKTSSLTLVESRCPTFSWGEVNGAKSYELVVYRLGEEDEEALEVLRQSFAGSVYSWTPPLGQCLRRGGQYAWSVRAVSRKEASGWSAPSLFVVASGPSEAEFEAALQVVREYLGKEEAGSVEGSAGVAGLLSGSSTPVTGSDGEAATGPSQRSVAIGDFALQVSGSPVVTVATLAGALCSSTELRFLDQGDGTVLDCNTGLIWLKDTQCVALEDWDDAFTKVASLNSGMEFNCTDYSAGAHSDWQVPDIDELCGSWSSGCTGTGCCTASTGIVDTNFSGPAVPNAAGDGKAVEEDPFVGNLTFSWSARPASGDNVWVVDLQTGNVLEVEKDFTTDARLLPVRGGQ